ncbi:hypothetical protein ABZ896_30075 [Streptomyces sp. NPDC047072]
MAERMSSPAAQLPTTEQIADRVAADRQVVRDVIAAKKTRSAGETAT